MSAIVDFIWKIQYKFHIKKEKKERERNRIYMIRQEEEVNAQRYIQRQREVQIQREREVHRQYIQRQREVHRQREVYRQRVDSMPSPIHRRIRSHIRREMHSPIPKPRQVIGIIKTVSEKKEIGIHTKENIDNIQCSICLDKIDCITNINFIEPCCGQVYHTYCICKWIKENRSCPICKTELELELN